MNDDNQTQQSNSKLLAALVAAKKKFTPAKKTATNPHYKSRYVDLASVMESCEAALLEHDLVIWHQPRLNGDQLELVTILSHVSGERIDCVWPIKPTRDDPQGLGSATTYARRYSVMALLGIAGEDDDGNEASGVKAEPQSKYPAKKAETSLAALAESPKPETPPASHVGAQVITLLDAAKTLDEVNRVVSDNSDALNALAAAEKKVMREIVQAARKRVNGASQ